jgi:hypothetical protein
MSAGRAAALVAILGAAAADGPTNDAPHIVPASLPAVLARIDAADPATRLGARCLAKRIALDWYEGSAPQGMRLVPGPITVAKDGVRCERGFYLGAHEVTVGEFREFARKAGLADRWAELDASLPATNVSLEEARAFATARGARLPTLAELERAARGGGRLRYPWGERFDPARVNSRESGRGRPEPVGARRGGLSVHGIADLLGNVAEWTETASGRRCFVAAGGSYRAEARPGAVSTYRLEPAARLPDVGFRLAKSLPPLLTCAPE